MTKSNASVSRTAQSPAESSATAASGTSLTRSTWNSAASTAQSTPVSANGSHNSSPNDPQSIMKLLGMNDQPEMIHSGEQCDSQAYPLFLIHDGSGVCVQYRRLASIDRAVFGIHDPKFPSSDAWADIPAMAEEYAELIRGANEKPCILGGWSFGGVVAFETARILIDTGHKVAGVVLIDSPPPVDHQPLSSKLIHAATAGPHGVEGGKGERRETIRELTRKSFARSAAMLGAFEPKDASGIGQPMPRIILLRAKEGFRLEDSQSNEPENLWLQDRSDPRTGVAGWESIVESKVSVIDVPGNHFQLFDGKNVSKQWDPRSSIPSNISR